MLSKVTLFTLLCILPCNIPLASSLCNEAVAMAKINEYQKAKELFIKAIKTNPYYYHAHYGYGKVCLLTGDISNAIKHLSIAVTLDAKAANGWFYLGFAYFFAKQYIKANQCFFEAYSINSSYIEALYNIGIIYEITGDTFKSNKYYEKYFAEKNKKDTGILF